MPLAQAFAFYAAIAIRYGSRPAGPSYADKDALSRADKPSRHRRRQH